MTRALCERDRLRRLWVARWRLANVLNLTEEEREALRSLVRRLSHDANGNRIGDVHVWFGRPRR